MYTTKVNIPSSPAKIGYTDRIASLGSCFSEHIGERLERSLFPVDINPFGVLYNPISIRNSILTLLDDRDFTEEDLFVHQSLWHSFSHSSAFSAPTPSECLRNINTRLHESRHFFKDTRFLLITFGTARVYRHNASGATVSNCHKLPAREFTNYRLSTEQITEAYRPLLHTLQTEMPGLQIIFTVSPIRHWKDGAHENNLSKSTLLLAIDALQREFDNVSYFPAYEIVMDELRDYRYYAADMLHPSDTAVNYIWERFAECYFSEETRSIKKEIEQLMADLSHRPLHPESDAFRTFCENTQRKKRLLEEKFPFIQTHARLKDAMPTTAGPNGAATCGERR